MRSSWLGVILTLAALTSAPSAARADDAATSRTATQTESLARLGRLRVGDPAPFFAGPDVRAPERAINRTKLLAAKRPFVLVFWATWCSPCRVGLAELRAAGERLKASGLEVVLVNYREPQDDVAAFLDAERLDGFSALLDKFGAVAKEFEVAPRETASLPKTFVVQVDGRIAAIFGAEGPDYVDRVIAAAGRAP
jgi:peroxiredoxin